MEDLLLPPQISAPIVLIHGLCGFSRMSKLRGRARDYFPGIRDYLEYAGNQVFTPLVSPTAGIVRRATELKQFIERNMPAGPVHLIGHSLGGLDARYMISQLGMHDRVLSLTTVGTPHRGSAFADWMVSRFARFLFPLFRQLGIPYEAYRDLTTESCKRFNEAVPDVPGVRYFAVAGVCERPWLGMEWRLPYRIVNRREGPNDGVVSVASATWGENTEVWDGDHLNLVNWPNRRARKKGVWQDRSAAYGRVLERLAAAGF